MDTVKAAGTVTVLSPFWETSVLVAVPEGVVQLEANTPLEPPLSTTRRSLRGMSGTPVKVVEFVDRLTAPDSVSPNGGGNTRVIDGAARAPGVPVR